MAINVTKTYKLGKKKETIEAWLYGELTATEAATTLGVTRQNFGLIVANIVRHMVMQGDPNFNKRFKERLKDY